MKKEKLLLISILLITVVCFSQTKSNTKNNVMQNNRFSKNEYWSSESGPNFEYYYFDKDGKFIHAYGYSGGIFYSTTVTGVYTYNAVSKEITIKDFKIYQDPMAAGRNKKPEPKKILVKDINNTAVTIIPGSVNGSYNSNMDTKIMSRTVGTTTDQYWYKGWNSSHNSISFRLSGQATIVQETNLRREYTCDYHIDGDYLFLEIKSVTIGNSNDDKPTKVFTPAIKTFLKVHIDKESVAVEQVDLNKIMDGKRNWEFKNMEFHIKNDSLNKITTARDEYHRVL